MTPRQQAENARMIWPLLVHFAKSRHVATYGEVGSLVGLHPHTQLPWDGLGPIYWYCVEHGLPPLTVLVVAAASGLPGTGFKVTEDIPQAQAQVFRYDWPAPPPVEALQAAWESRPVGADGKLSTYATATAV